MGRALLLPPMSEMDPWQCTDDWCGPVPRVPPTASVFFLRMPEFFERESPRLSEVLDPVIDINEQIAARVTVGATHRVDNVPCGETELRIRQPRGDSGVTMVELSPSHSHRYFFLLADERQVWFLQETDPTTFAKHETSSLIEFHVLCSAEVLTAIRVGGASLHFVRRNWSFGRDIAPALVVNDCFVDTVHAGSSHIVSMPGGANITFQLIGSQETGEISFHFVPIRLRNAVFLSVRTAKRYLAHVLPGGHYYFAVQVEPTLLEGGVWKIETLTKEQFVYGKGDETDSEEEQPIERQHVLSFVQM